MNPTIAFFILYIVHGFVGHIPYPDYYYSGPVEDLKEACTGYWYAAIFGGGISHGAKTKTTPIL
jgi:hypothetical protein